MPWQLHPRHRGRFKESELSFGLFSCLVRWALRRSRGRFAGSVFEFRTQQTPWVLPQTEHREVLRPTAIGRVRYAKGAVRFRDQQCLEEFCHRHRASTVRFRGRQKTCRSVRERKLCLSHQTIGGWSSKLSTPGNLPNFRFNKHLHVVGIWQICCRCSRMFLLNQRQKQ